MPGILDFVIVSWFLITDFGRKGLLTHEGCQYNGIA